MPIILDDIIMGQALLIVFSTVACLAAPPSPAANRRPRHHRGHGFVNRFIPPEARNEPPLRGNVFSIVLPFFPPQIGQLRASMLAIARHIDVNDVDKLLLSSPCNEEPMINAAIRCSEVRGRPERSSPELDEDGLSIFRDTMLIGDIEANGGRLDQFPEWRDGRCGRQVFDWMPTGKVEHYCDDIVICGKVRGCFLSEQMTRNKRAPLGWYVQQMVKLGLSRFATSPHLLILDADNFAFGSISAGSILNTINGTSKILSTRAVIEGTPITSEVVGGRWSPRYKIALKLLHAHENSTVPATTLVLGVTPETLSTVVTRRILDRLEELHQAPWFTVLGYVRFTEFTLYNTFLMLEWESFRHVHDVPPSLEKTRQLAIWAHDLEAAKGISTNDRIQTTEGVIPTTQKKPILVLAEKVVKRQLVHSVSMKVSPFFVCQDESGLAPEECAALAQCTGEILREDPELRRIRETDFRVDFRRLR